MATPQRAHSIVTRTCGALCRRACGGALAPALRWLPHAVAIWQRLLPDCWPCGGSRPQLCAPSPMGAFADQVLRQYHHVLSRNHTSGMHACSMISRMRLHKRKTDSVLSSLQAHPHLCSCAAVAVGWDLSPPLQPVPQRLRQLAQALVQPRRREQPQLQLQLQAILPP